MTSRYRNDAPAARRAMQVLEQLARAPRGSRLTDLSRELGIGPSSMLALLATLREGGYVVREGDCYRVGSGLAALGAEAAARIDPGEAFRSAAAALVEKTGETALLWRIEEEEAVVVAAHEGWRDLRLVPRVGLRIPLAAGAPMREAFASGPSRYVVGELEPGLALWAAPVPGIPGCALSVAGPSARSRDADIGRSVQFAAERMAALAGTRAAGPAEEPNPPIAEDASRPSGSGALSLEELSAFLVEPLIAVLAYQNEDGYPTTVPVWFHWDDRAFWLLPGPGARWAAQLPDSPRVSLTVGEIGPPFRRVNAEGAAVVLADPALAGRVRAALARRYATTGARDPAWRDVRESVVRIDPIRVRSWRGLGARPDRANASEVSA